MEDAQVANVFTVQRDATSNKATTVTFGYAKQTAALGPAQSTGAARGRDQAMTPAQRRAAELRVSTSQALRYHQSQAEGQLANTVDSLLEDAEQQEQRQREQADAKAKATADLASHPHRAICIIVQRWAGLSDRDPAYPARALYNILPRLKYLQQQLADLAAWLASPRHRQAELDAAGQLDAWLLQSRLLDALRDVGLPDVPDLQHVTSPLRIAGLDEVVSWTVHEFQDKLTQASVLLAAGLTSFDGLALLMAPGSIVTTAVSNMSTERLACRVLSCHYSETHDRRGAIRRFHVELMFAAALLDDGVAPIIYQDQVPEYSQTRSIEIGFYRPLDLKTDLAGVQHLRRRGELYQRFARGKHYLVYGAHGFTPIPLSYDPSDGSAEDPLPLADPGRIIVDPVGAVAHVPTLFGLDPATTALAAATAQLQRRKRRQERGLSAEAAARDDDHQTRPTAAAAYVSEQTCVLGPLLQTLPPALQLLTWPAVSGFSMTTKSWGRCMVEALSDMAFDQSAFDKIVMADERKELIRAISQPGLVDEFVDIIGGKGAGSVFLLHGPPGVGKTLTAEVLAERMRCPLYVVTMGELGTDPETLERRLQQVLDQCWRWDAIVLLDEADVFLERRDKSEINRNALVSVMLRLLEYHRGIVFLTSNRVSNLDPAVASRVTLALGYASLDVSMRQQVWSTLLQHTTTARIDVTEPQLRDLASRPLNGRQIKNAIRLAVSLAAFRKEQVTFGHLQRTVKQLASLTVS